MCGDKYAGLRVGGVSIEKEDVVGETFLNYVAAEEENVKEIEKVYGSVNKGLEDIE